MSNRVAAVDCGTNSIRLLIADVQPDGTLADVHREMRIVRLGQGVDATGAFAPEAIERTRVALADYAATMREAKVDRVRMVATSATRDASNREDFFGMARELLGTVVSGAEAEVITGDEEARLSFSGAIGELAADEAPYVVVDLGGGSTELVFGDADGVRAAFSADIGCVRITERSMPGNPPTPDQLAAAREFAAERLAAAFAAVPVEEARTWVGVAGTMTTIAAVALELPEYDASKVHLSRLSLEQVHAVSDRLTSLDHDQRAALGPVHPGRVDVIGGGALIVRVLADELARRAGISELVVSEHDILDGIALSIA
ncbi:Ppx/GppA phosphatase family protein [Nocardia asteroides]|uniref:Ppx/GppA phosphatase family protein n=1 Tax=Nocardia asteroides TaxID=1824 RepID=UPI001E36E5BF|nr:Ppx/GppA phosphatase family protein [Nocardia asteroides]UGT64349.1 Ppx/GppA family phosphatase [Nocardia asteroides]